MKNYYCFIGDVCLFEKVLASNVYFSTTAVSLPRAVSNIKFQARKRLGYQNNIPIKLVGDVKKGKEI